MDKATRKLLDQRVAYLNRRLGLSTDPYHSRGFYLSSYRPDRKRLYQLMESYSKGPSSGDHAVSRFLEANEMRWYLEGMIDMIDGYATAGGING